MIPGQHISPEDLAIYAMQLLSSDEAAPIMQHLEQCPECRAELQAVSRDLALYALTAEMHTPPAQSRQRLMKQVARERRKVIPVDSAKAATPVPAEEHTPLLAGRSQNVLSSFDIEETSKRNVAGMALGWAGWAAAAGIGFFAMNLYHERDALKAAQSGQQQTIAKLNEDANKARQVSDMLSDPNAMRVTLTPTKLALPATPLARVVYAANKGILIMQASNMEPLQTYKTYELWIIPADGRDPMPAGTFRPDPQGNVSMISPDIPKGVAAKEFGITVEDEGGSKVPTAPIIMVGL